MASSFLDINGLNHLVSKIKAYVQGATVARATTAGRANQVGTRTVGSSTRPIFLNLGVPQQCGTSLGVSITGNAATATQLRTGRTLKVNLQRDDASTAFNGTANIDNIGVAGVLPVSHGGTGATSLANLQVGTAGVASKLGTQSVGSATQPIFLVNGSPTASGQTVGSGVKPIYMSSGVLTASNSSVAGSQQIMYLQNGTFTGGISITYGTAEPSGGSNGDIYIQYS